MERKFTKNDNGFVCANCDTLVEPLGYTSRDHCPNCLVSIHIDHNPGDRANDCKGLLIPISVSYNNNKGYVITYKCQKCGQLHNNKMAEDDNFDTLLKVMNGTYNYENYKK